MPLLGEAPPFTLWAVLFTLAALGFGVDGHRRLRKTSGALWVIGGGALLSNTGVTPFSAGQYDTVFGTLLPVAIPLLLFRAGLGRIFRESGRVMLTFLCASLATVIAAAVSLLIVDLGNRGPEVAGVIAAGYIGGTMNFVAVSRAVGMEPGLFAVTLGANSVVSVMALMALVALPSLALVRRLVPSRRTPGETAADGSGEPGRQSRFLPVHVCFALGLSLSLCAAADAVAAALGIEQYSLLLVTAFAVLLASIAPGPLGRLEGEFELGMLLMYLFFAAVGLSTDVTTFLASAIDLFVYALLTVALHLLLVLLCARLLRFDLSEALVGSAAALVGPGPAAAIAGANGWHRLITPGIVCGLFGYVIANFVGVTLARLAG